MKYTWLVEKYLEGELSGEDLRRFELDILRKPEVAEEVEKMRSLQQFITKQHVKLHNSPNLIEDFSDLANVIPEDKIGEELEELKVRKISAKKNDITELENRLSELQIRDKLNRQNSNKVLVRKVSVWMVAASLATLMVVASLLIFGVDHTDYVSLYTEYYSPRPADVARAMIENDPIPKNEGISHYNKSEYSEAFRLFNEIPEQEMSNDIYLYKGISAMELGYFSMAIELFNQLDADNMLMHESLWYKSLCFLHQGDEISTRLALEEIIHNNGYYKTNANSLLKKL